MQTPITSPLHTSHGRLALTCVALAGALAAPSFACRNRTATLSTPEGGYHGRSTYDTSPIAVARFAEDPAVAGRVLNMPWGEAADRLGSLSFEGHSQFVFGRGNEDLEQADVVKAVQDSRGNFVVTVDTGTHRVEMYLVGEEVFVREDKGHLRKKPRREVATDAWCDLAWSSVRQSLDLFQPRLRFGDPRPENLAGRAVVRYSLTLAEPGALSVVAAPVDHGSLPVAPRARWRELSRPLDVTGSAWVDSTSGVLLKLKVDGRLEIADRNIRPTQLSFRYEGAVSKVGAVAAVLAPTSVQEYVRTPPPGDPIDFFRAELEQAGLVPAPHRAKEDPPGSDEQDSP